MTKVRQLRPRPLKLYRIVMRHEFIFKAKDDDEVKQIWAGFFPESLYDRAENEEERMENGSLLSETMSEIKIENLTDGTSINHEEIPLEGENE